MKNPLESLVEELRRLPGVGAKSARRMAYYFVELDEENYQRFIDTLQEAKTVVKRCSTCFALGFGDPCEFCSDDKRDKSTVLVVETARDVMAMERTGGYQGLYHVLEGALSPIDGIGAEDIRIRELVARLRDDSIKEVIVATDPDVEGEATALYLARLLKPSGVKVSRIARGIPMGGDIEYADELTLGGALSNRQEM